MLISLKELMSGNTESISFNLELDLSDLEFFSIFPIKRPVSVKGEISNKSSIITLKGEAIFDYEAPCDRCTQPTVRKFTSPLDFIIVNESNEEEDDNIILAKNDEIDIHELITDSVLTILPTKHLCHNNCKGLCQNCGCNLNKEGCNCSKEPVDQRLQKLRELL